MSGVDRVIISPGSPVVALRRFLDGWGARWPDMRTAVDGVLGSEFFRWHDVRPALPDGQGEILVARDAAMNDDWDEHGYRLLPEGEGPFYILYRRAPTNLRVLALQDPFGLDYRFEPYERELVGGGLSLVTVVLPDADGEFSRGVMAAARDALLGPVGAGP
ncbi:MAG TPA: hypothetical protein VFW65_09960 [Pseudonocardiaceae bacterium]|nr:hypothetical protein [Pseudonocardiaceae bacterium]